MRRIVIAHGGTASKPDMSDGPEAAAQAGLKALRDGDSLDAVAAAVSVLEDDERFNAGTGSNPRLDGATYEMDAAVMDSRKKYGAVSAIRRVRNPVQVARALVGKPNNILTGEGATSFARVVGHGDHDVATKRAEKRWKELVDLIARGEDSASDNEWEYEALRESWNYAKPFEEVFPRKWAPRKGSSTRVGASDTVGAVAYDGKTFAAATSTGGTIVTLLGRVGDTPNIGCGIFAGEFGCVAISGNGDRILRERAATMVHGWMGEGFSAQEALTRLVSRYDETTDVWACAIGLRGHAGHGNRDIAWAVAEE